MISVKANGHFANIRFSVPYKEKETIDALASALRKLGRGSPRFIQNGEACIELVERLEKPVRLRDETVQTNTGNKV